MLKNNKIIGYHSLVGPISLDDILNYIDIINDNYNTLELLISNFINSKSHEDKELLEEFIEDCIIGNNLANISYILNTLD